MPLAIRVDVEACYRTQRAWTADPLWQRAYLAALKALALTVATKLNGATPAAQARKRAVKRRAALARWR